MAEKPVINVVIINESRWFSGRLRRYWSKQARDAKIQRQLDELATELSASPDKEFNIPLTMRLQAEIKEGYSLEEQDNLALTKADLLKATPYIAGKARGKLFEKVILFVIRRESIPFKLIGAAFGKETKQR